MMFLQLIGLLDICFNLFRVARCSGLWAPASNFAPLPKIMRSGLVVLFQEWPLPKNLVAWRCGSILEMKRDEDLTLQ